MKFTKPPAKMISVTVELPIDLFFKLQRVADARDQTASGMFVEIFERTLQGLEQEAKLCRDDEGGADDDR